MKRADPVIDIVIPWVNGEDPVWQEVHEQYASTSREDNHISRYRQWDVFRYWFRMIEENAPWVRTIHFVTWGHVPSWLDTEHPKLHIVNHRDFISDRFLPTFSSHTIELNMHRIEGLADRFIYFNDDVYLTKKTSQEDFFHHGKPRDSAVLGIIKNDAMENFMPYIMLNMMAIINERFSKKDVIRKYPLRWMNPRYGKYLLNNAYLLPWGCFTGIRNFHTGVPYEKATLEEVWREIPEVLESTCERKFRGREDVNQYIFRYWRLMKGEFFPSRPNSDYVTIGKTDTKTIETLMGENTILCINDDPGDFDAEVENKKLEQLFRKYYPHRSSFEIE